ncbi:ISLre2 family transposase, partial [Lactobacillus xujianguonis]
SNHRKYTYRVKGQGKYWSEAGAEGMLRILTCIKNGDLEEWLNSDFETSKLISLDRKKLQAAARDSLRIRHEIHTGIQHGALTAAVVGGSYLSKFNRMLNHINY